ncbi:hypothetical protein [Xenorhabdus thailandensis]|uniref:hypothetical protein n=1 Tax=Xenorhabdus thailandensis TaxID=3136255 RepID=UPI0030F47B45
MVILPPIPRNERHLMKKWRKKRTIRSMPSVFYPFSCFIEVSQFSTLPKHVVLLSLLYGVG